MPDFEGLLPLALLFIFISSRIAAARKRNRQRQEQAQAEAAGGFEGAPARQETAVAAPPEARRPGLRDQLRDMGRQLEEQMQQAAAEGRPGSVVGHVEPGEAPETPGMLRPTRSAPRPSAPKPSARPAPPVRAASRGPAAGPALEVARSARRGGQPLARLERYSPLARAVILSEILGPPPSLPREPEIGPPPGLPREPEN